MPQRTRQSIRRQYCADHAVVFDHATQLGDRGRNILQRQNRDALQPWFLPQKAIVKIIVVGLAQIDGEIRHADLTDMHEARGINDGGFDIALIERLAPIFERRN